MLRFGNFVLLINEDNYRVECAHLARFEPCFGEDDDFIAGLEVACRRAVQADVTFAALAGHDICLPEDAVRDVCDIYILKWFHPRRIDDVLVDCNRAHVVEVGLGDGRPMDFRHTDAN